MTSVVFSWRSLAEMAEVLADSKAMIAIGKNLEYIKDIKLIHNI